MCGGDAESNSVADLESNSGMDMESVQSGSGSRYIYKAILSQFKLLCLPTITMYNASIL